jgi:8-oxo-dGTP pyrophosphatase MutT (NUDIX family)
MEACFNEQNIVIDFTESTFNTTMKNVEQLYWHYLDKYNAKCANTYPWITPYHFLSKYLKWRGVNLSFETVKHYWRRYEKYKKMIPTAGIIIKHENDIVVVRVNGSTVFSMPKGKFEDTDGSLINTAIREAHEETGMTISSTQLKEGPNILKTVFYLFELDNKVEQFTGFNTNEITEVVSVNLNEILTHPERFSKQVYQVAEYLLLSSDSVF